MDELTLGLVKYVNYFDTGFYHQIEREWDDVDGILERQEFSNLKSVRVYHSAHGSAKPERLEWFFLRLPLCRKQGILRLYKWPKHMTRQRRQQFVFLVLRFQYC
jgi:hypothetical protein